MKDEPLQTSCPTRRKIGVKEDADPDTVYERVDGAGRQKVEDTKRWLTAPGALCSRRTIRPELSRGQMEGSEKQTGEEEWLM